MLFKWLKAQPAVDAGAALADTFPTRAAGAAVGEFMRTATQHLRARNLNFYQRARFANAFKWRLLENGVAADTARDVTQTLLISSSAASGAPAPLPGAAAAREPAEAKSPAVARSSGRPVDGKALDALFRQAEKAFGSGEFDAAVVHYQEYLAARPRDTAGINNLAVAFLKLGKYSDAIEQLRKAVARNPKNVEAYSNLGNALLQLHRYHAAGEALRRVVSLKSTDLAARSNLAVTLVMTGRTDSARVELDTVLKKTPEHAGALCAMGLLERAHGRWPEAEALLWRAVQADPHCIRAWAAIPSLRRMSQADSKWVQHAERAAASARSPADEAALRYALAKYYDDVGEYSQALASLQRAHSLSKPFAPAFAVNAYAAFVDDMTNTYTASALAGARLTDSSPLRPAFVIGMAGSGVRLAGQILAMHPKVTGAGRLDFWQVAAGGDDNRVRHKILPPNARRKLAFEFLAAIGRLSPTPDAVVDAVPANADYVGLIHSVLPNARFIFMRRDPRETCLSCYFQPFTGTRNFAFDPGDLTAYHAQHARLMAHWRSVLPPGSILDVTYEELVTDLEPTNRRMLGFLGLEPDERCLQLAMRPASSGRSRNYPGTKVAA